METRKCSKCGEEKALSLFYTDGKYYRPECKTCHLILKKQRESADPYKTSLFNMVSGIFHRIQTHVDSEKNKTYKERGIKCLLGDTREEARKTLHQHYKKEILALLKQGKTPSVDRIDSHGHYEIGNIRIIPLEENIRMGSVKGGEAVAKSIYAFDKDGSVLGLFHSVSSCARHLNLKRDTVIRHAQNGTSTRYGLSFQYVEE